VYEKLIPLVSGYLQAYACKDQDIRGSYSFDIYSVTMTTPPELILRELLEKKSQIYAFSCYIWNIKLVNSLVSSLRRELPDASFILGGPQVMHHAKEYLEPQNEKVFICNGEGEKTFANFLREQINEAPDFNSVRGLSFYQDQKLITTPAEERIQDLDEIPSPFQSGLFDKRYHWSMFETNRGCPFRCSFCYWGAANNDRVYRFSEERVINDLSWISEKHIPFVFIVDANWGMLKRDIQFSKHIAECKKRNKTPLYVGFASAKNSSNRAAEAVEIFYNAGLQTYSTISLQSLDNTTLEKVERKNIKLSAFESLQERLNDRGINSNIELIWPLPGETLESFVQGIEALCMRSAQIITVYAHILLHNTPLYHKQDEFGLVVHKVNDSIGETDIIVQTNEVSYEGFKKGWWFYCAMTAFHNTQSFVSLRSYLHKTGVMSYAQFFAAFAAFCQYKPTDSFSRYCELSISNAEIHDKLNIPKLYHLTLHEERAGFEELVYRFVSSQDWWEDEYARLLFEIDLVKRPHIYSNTPVEASQVPFDSLKLIKTAHCDYTVEIPNCHLPLLDQQLWQNVTSNQQTGYSSFHLKHKHGQLPYNPEQPLDADYLASMVLSLSMRAPVYTLIKADKS